MNSENYSKKAGFTLIEVLLVVVIIMIMTALAIPSFSKSFKVKFNSYYLEGIVSKFNNQFFFYDFKLNNNEEIIVATDFSNYNHLSSFSEAGNNNYKGWI